ncbi:MAG: hypothetical protein HYT03_03640 [Candidatus Harrisonbacteria bacterium]|nr:hypothetical protein [Candidatus Harrisonbacteria bacterium]
MGKALILGFFLIQGLNFLALANGWYILLPWYDSALHFLGGVWASALFVWFFNSKRIGNQTRPVLIIFAISFTALIGVIWEFAEFTFLNRWMAAIFQTNETGGGLADTLTDLLFDLLGGGFFVIAYLKSRKN